MSDSENEIVLSNDELGGNLSVYTPEDLAAVTSGGGFLPRFMVAGSNSDCVKEGKIKIGTFAVAYSDERIEQLGSEVDVNAITVRTKALRINDTPKGKTVQEYYDRNSAAFKQVAIDSAAANSGCMFGPEFLLWIPNANEGEGTFATYFLGSKTGRREAPNMLALMTKNGQLAPSWLTLEVYLIATKSYKWHASKSRPCSAPNGILPDREDLIGIVKRFNNPPAPKVETIGTADDRAR